MCLLVGEVRPVVWAVVEGTRSGPHDLVHLAPPARRGRESSIGLPGSTPAVGPTAGPSTWIRLDATATTWGAGGQHTQMRETRGTVRCRRELAGLAVVLAVTLLGAACSPPTDAARPTGAGDAAAAVGT